MTAKYPSALTCFSAQHQPRILPSLALLATRHAAATTLAAVVTTLTALRHQLTGARHLARTEDLTQTTAQDSSACITAAQASGLAPSTIHTPVGLLAGFLAYLRAEGQMTPPPVRRRRPRLLTPLVLPTPLPDADLSACFPGIEAVRDRRRFLCMRRGGVRVSAVGALPWDALDRCAGTVRINRGTGHVDRIVSLAPDVEQALEIWRAHATLGLYLCPSPQRQSAHLFRSHSNGLMHPYRAAAGLPRHSSPPCLRHTCAPHLRNAGVSLEVLKALLGHHSIALTLRSTPRYDTTKKHP